MIIRTITCHDVYNYGASLQAYALQAYLEGQGHDVRIIDYKPDYLSGHYRLWALPPAYDKPLLRYAYLMAKLPGRLLALRRKAAFDRFTASYQKLTRRYNSNKELAEDPPQADAYIAGSDQIWNTRFPNGKDEAFYLAFAPKSSLRLSYAASFAHASIQPEYTGFVKKELANLNRISVRESSGVKLLASLGYEGIQVCDPVFLLSASEWMKVIDQDFAGQLYIVVYDFERSKAVRSLAKRLARLLNCKIYSAGPFAASYANKDFVNHGPSTFVSLIRNAQCVLSNSFHGTAFSLLFNRNFFIIKRADGLNDRMLNVLKHFNIEGRMIDETASDEVLASPIDYAGVKAQLEHDISESKAFLHKALNDCAR